MKQRRSISRRALLRTAGIGTLLTVLDGCITQAVQPKKAKNPRLAKPNVLLIVCDDLNDYIGVMGGHPQAKTPNIDRLASQGVLFANAHSNAPICAPSRASFMSGILPHTSRNYGFAAWQKNKVLSNSKMLPEYMAENGYKTYATGKINHHEKWNMWTEHGLKQSFGPVAWNGKTSAAHPSVPVAFSSVGLLDGNFAPLSDIPSVPRSDKAPGYTGWWNVAENKPFRYVNDDDRDKMWDERSAEWFRKKITRFAAEPNADPFLFAIGIMRPHTPHYVPKKYYDMYPLQTLQLPVIKEGDGDDCGMKKLFGGTKGYHHFEALKRAYGDVKKGLKIYTQSYLACVSFVDDVIGHLMETLDKSPFADNTIVIMCGDHGYNLGEKDWLFKNSLWNESTRVPFIVRAPGYEKSKGGVVEHPISLVDIYATVADMCKLKGDTRKNNKGAQLDGHSIEPFLADPKNGSWTGPDVALSLVKNRNDDNPSLQNYAVRSRQYRYIHYCDGFEELYDHEKDPYEWTNQAKNPKFADIKANLRKQMFRLVSGKTDRDT